jgi:hypothetical protein
MAAITVKYYALHSPGMTAPHSVQRAVSTTDTFHVLWIASADELW